VASYIYRQIGPGAERHGRTGASPAWRHLGGWRGGKGLLPQVAQWESCT